MSIETTKDITVPAHTVGASEVPARDYQVGLLTALVGDWVSRTLTTREAVKNEELYRKVQSYCLETVKFYQDGANGVRGLLKLFSNGKFLNPKLQLEYDLETVNVLCEETLAFNFDSFFKRKFAKAEAEQAQALSEPQAS